MTRYHTPREVARRLRVSPTTVMRAIHEERLFAVRVSERVYRIPVGALARFERDEPEPIAVPAIDVPEFSEPGPAQPVGDTVGAIALAEARGGSDGGDGPRPRRDQ